MDSVSTRSPSKTASRLTLQSQTCAPNAMKGSDSASTKEDAQPALTSMLLVQAVFLSTRMLLFASHVLLLQLLRTVLANSKDVKILRFRLLTMNSLLFVSPARLDFRYMTMFVLNAQAFKSSIPSTGWTVPPALLTKMVNHGTVFPASMKRKSCSITISTT